MKNYLALLLFYSLASLVAPSLPGASAQPQASIVPTKAQQLVRRFQTRGSAVALAFSDDNRYLAAAGDYQVNRRDSTWEDRISVWELESGKLVSSFTTRGHVNFLAFRDRQGRELWSGAEEAGDFGEVVLWDVQSGNSQKRFRCPDDLTYMALSPDKSQIVVEPYGSVLLLNAKTLKVQKQLKFKEGEAIQDPIHYSADSRLLLMTQPTSQKISIWDARSGALLHTLAFNKGEGASEVWFHDSKNRYFLSGGERFALRDAQNLRVVKTLGLYPSGTVVLSPSQKWAFSGDCDVRGDDPHNPYAVRVWDVQRDKLLIKWKGHTNNIRSGAFSRDERLLASGDSTGRINVWNLSSLHP